MFHGGLVHTDAAQKINREANKKGEHHNRHADKQHYVSDWNETHEKSMYRDANTHSSTAWATKKAQPVRAGEAVKPYVGVDTTEIVTTYVPHNVTNTKETGRWTRSRCGWCEEVGLVLRPPCGCRWGGVKKSAWCYNHPVGVQVAGTGTDETECEQ